MTGTLTRIFLEAVFPRYCVSCSEEGRLLCFECAAQWNPSQPVTSAEHVWSYSYADPIARKLICAWKYDYDYSARDILFAKLIPRLHILEQMCESAKIQAIVPVSLHSRRRCERGFDQSVQLSTFLSGSLGIRTLEAVVRARSTHRQVERTHSERVSSMGKNPFSALRVLPDRILLVDDVWTTGATANAARKALQECGASKVLVYTIAKG